MTAPPEVAAWLAKVQAFADNMRAQGIHVGVGERGEVVCVTCAEQWPCSKVTRDLMAAGAAKKRARGGYVGGQVAYGQRAEGRELVQNPAERRVIEHIFELYRCGHSYREIAAILESEGCRAKRGGPWHPMSIQRIVRREVAAGAERPAPPAIAELL